MAGQGRQRVRFGLGLMVLVLMLGAMVASTVGCTDWVKRSLQLHPVQRDLPEILQRDTLRVISRNHPLSYYLYKGTRRGFDFELIQRFAEEQGLVVEVIIPPTWEDMLSYLYTGRGDVIAAQMTVTPEREKLVAFTRPYMEVTQVTVGTDEQPPPETLEGLDGDTVLVRRGSSYEERMRELQRQGLSINIEYHDEIGETDDPVQFVARGKHPLTVVDNTIARLEQHFYPGLLIGAEVSEPQGIAWAVRPNSPELLTALNDFIARHHRSAFFNVIKRRYFENRSRFLRHRSAHLALFQEGRISRYDDIFREVAQEYGFDWRLLAAQAYHESRFYPDKVSWAGAVGLMQLMPRTARAMGVQNYWEPRANITAGTRYMKRLWDIYDEAASEEDRLKLTLAAYNAGMTHLANARRLTRARGGDPNVWEDVAESLVLLEKPDVYQQEGYAFVRGRMVRQYVVDVLERYEIFKTLLRDAETPPDTGLVLAFR